MNRASNNSLKASLTLAEAQQQVDAWIHQYGKGYFDPLTNMSLFVEELGELARHMARHYGMQKPKTKDASYDPMVAIKEEMGDIFWILCCLANQTGIDLGLAFRSSLDKKTKRDKERYMK